MQTQKPAEQKAEQSSGKVSNNLKNVPASQKPVTKNNTVRTTEYKKIIELCLTDPDSITREEFMAFQSAIGYGQMLRMMQEGMRRKKAAKGDKKGTDATTTAEKSKGKTDTAKQTKAVEKNNTNQAKANKDEATELSKEKSLTKTLIDNAKPKSSVNKSSDETKTVQSTSTTTTSTSKGQSTNKAAISSSTTKQETPTSTNAATKKTTSKVAAKTKATAAAKKAANTVRKMAAKVTARGTVKSAPKATSKVASKATGVVAAQTIQPVEQPEVDVEEPALQGNKKKMLAANAETDKGKGSDKEEKAKTSKTKHADAQKSATKTTNVEKSVASNKGSNVESKAPVQATSSGKGSGGSKAASAPASGGASILGKEGGGAKGPSAKKIKESLQPKRQVKPTPKITGEDPGNIIKQLGNSDPTQVINTFSDANAASKGAFNNEREKSQKQLPEMQTPTGLAPVEKQGQINKKQDPIAHKAISAFEATKSGGDAQEGNIKDFSLGESENLDEKDVMNEARACTQNAPEVNMSGEADPSQIDGFKSEAQGNVNESKQAEQTQIKQEFGENNIKPKIDKTILKAKQAIRAAAPKNIEIKKMEPTKDDVASRVDPSVNDTLKKYMDKQNGEYAKGKADYDKGIVAEKQKADQKIESEKAQASDKQIEEQNKAKADVEGYRGQWQSEIDQATSEYDTEANSEVEGKKKEVGTIKSDKDKEVKSTLKSAEKDAENKCDTAKKDADAKQKEGEKEHESKKKSWFGRAVDWVKDKAKKIVDGIKSAINGIFNALRSAVKAIFEAAKKAALAVIEAGRKLIVNCIKALGDLLKKIVTKLLAKFPAIAKKICDLIDKAVNKAVEIVNKIADGLKKAVTLILDTMAKGFDGLFAGLQKLYNGIMDGIKNFLNGDFMKILKAALEVAQIAAELALAFATGGGSVLIQIAKWLVTTLPGLINKAKAIMGFVNTIKSIKLGDIGKLLKPSGIAGFLVKGLFGELSQLPGAESEKGDKDAKEPASGGGEKGLMKILSVLSNVLNKIKGVYGKVAGAINKVLPNINITKKSWFSPFSMIYVGVVKVIEVAKNPAQALGEGVGSLKTAAGNFFGSIKTKVTDVAGFIKEKVAILGKPVELIKVILNKGVDMVLNFIITNPPSALLKALFKMIEAVAGKSLVELIRQTIPFADKLLNKISESGPVQAIASPLKGPIGKLSGAIESVTTKITGMIDDAEQKTTSSLGSGDKLISSFAGGKGGKGGGNGGGDFFGTLKSGIHTRLMTYGERNLLSKGKDLLKAGVNKGKDLAKKGWNKGKEAVKSGADKLKQMLTKKKKFKLGNETHELWVEKNEDKKNVIMMASSRPGRLIDKLDKNIQKQVKSNLGNLQTNPNDATAQNTAKKIENVTYLAQVDSIVKLMADDKISKNCTFEEAYEKYSTKSKIYKYTKKEIAGAYYKYTGKTDRLDDIDYQRILADDGRPVTQDGVKDDEVKNHAHHINYKKGQDGAMNDIAMKGHEILRRYDIDPVLDPKNLVPAPNTGHSEENIQQVVDKLKDTEEFAKKQCDLMGKTGDDRKQYVKEALYDALEELGEDAKNRPRKKKEKAKKEKG